MWKRKLETEAVEMANFLWKRKLKLEAIKGYRYRFAIHIKRQKFEYGISSYEVRDEK